jgi:hypothetical protein
MVSATFGDTEKNQTDVVDQDDEKYTGDDRSEKD